MSSYSYPYGVDPARQYYVQAHPPPPPGYPANGYPPAPQSPGAAPPARPHTTAPFPSPSQYAPPPGAIYYGVPPPQPNGHPPNGAPPPPPPAGYPPQAPAPAPAAAAPGSPFGDMSPEQIQGMIDQLKSLKVSKSSPAPGPPPVPAGGHNGHPSHSPPPRIDTSMQPPPPGPHGVPQSARGHHPTPSQSSQYPPYPYYHKPSSHSGELSPPAPPPQGYTPSQPKPPPGPMPGSFFPEPAPPHAPAPPPKTPAAAPAPGRPESTRKVSEQTSETSFESGKSHDLHQAFEQWGGKLVEISQGREPRPKPKLIALFRGIAAYMIALLEPTHSCVVTLNKLIQFYHTFAVSGDEAREWQGFFQHRTPKSLSELFCALNVEHHLVPTKPNQPPTVPGLTPRGFEVWMFTQLMTAPEREWHRISRILEHWTIFDQGFEMPKVIPRKCFPLAEDRAIYQGWWQAVREDYPEDFFDSDDERKVPLGLPEPERRRRGYSIRGGDLPHELSPTEDESKDSPPPAPPSLARQRTSRPYATKDVIPDPRDFLMAEEKQNSPTERYRQPYGSAPNPAWKEDPSRRDDINPRPTLGEEPAARPPTRSRSVKASKTPASKEPLPSSRRTTTNKRGRSVHRKREESPDARYISDEDYSDGYGRRLEGDGLYESLYEEPPPSSSHYHHHHHPREPSRGPPKSRPPPPPPAAPAPVEKDIRDFTYQDQYEREKEYATPTVSAGGRRQHRGSDAHARGRDNRRDTWR
ncbi:hypothetical protein K440DRAFT_391523 [Wilcoxina mikolae CBS 423.85]|nr:hypothetical protein K440DRAFT_391523 [Wilcoxina mikolae CBS 423.85]